MRQRLQKIYWTGILITLIMAFCAIAAAAGLKISDTGNHLTALLKAASQWTLDSDDDLQSLADSMAEVSPSLRVTFLLDSGVIIADSRRKVHSSESHSSDPDIIAAREGRTGSRVSISETNIELVLYMAQRVSPQLLLRISYPVFEIARIVLIYGSILLVLFLILYFIQRAAITKYAKDIQLQFEEIRELLDEETLQAEAVFPELQPSLDAISYRVKRLKDDQEEILRTMNLRSDFVANASHELKSPLTSIMGYTEMLTEGMAITEEERQLCLKMIHSESARMLEVIDEILRLRKAEKLLGTGEVTEVLPVAEEVKCALQPQAVRKNIQIFVNGEMTVRAGERDVWEILYNLTDNAVRYSPGGGSVQITLRPGCITVEDEGIGIEENQIQRIFEPFYRVEETREQTAGGTGLGLSIVKEIIQSCGGTIRVRSQPGTGSCFTVIFPEEANDCSDTEKRQR